MGVWVPLHTRVPLAQDASGHVSGCFQLSEHPLSHPLFKQDFHLFCQFCEHLHFLLMTMSFLQQLANMGFCCLWFRFRWICLSHKEPLGAVSIRSEAGKPQEVLFIYRYLKGCHVEEKQTASVRLQKAKRDG